jgi:hypothetical protein
MQQFLAESLWSTYQNAGRCIPEDTSLKIFSFQKEQVQVTEKHEIMFVFDPLEGKYHECFMEV